MRNSPRIQRPLFFPAFVILISIIPKLCQHVLGQTPAVAFSSPLAAPPPGTFDFAKDRQPVILLNDPWRFHSGDDPAWANAAFDDSAWGLVSPGKPAFVGSGWYRARIQIPAGQGSLSLYVPRTNIDYQIFADGQLITSMGGMPPQPLAYRVSPQVVSLPKLESTTSHTLTLALRAWYPPKMASFAKGGLSPGLRIGDTALIQTFSELTADRIAWRSVSEVIIAVLVGLSALTSLALFAFRTREYEYLWFAIMNLFDVAGRCFLLYAPFHTLGANFSSNVFILTNAAEGLAEMAFYSRLLAGKRNWLFWGAILIGLGPAASTLLGVLDQAPVAAARVIIYVLCGLPSMAWILALVIRRAFQGFPDARLLLAPVLTSKLITIFTFSLQASFFAGWALDHSDWAQHLGSWPFEYGLWDIGDTFFLIGMLAVLIHRFTRTRLHEETYEHEREAARTVQELLIPANHPQIPGFEITSIYNPASEISGDFFQVIPLEGDSVLIAIGDVSGKGLPAALMVSLLVGTLGTYTETLTDPAEVLAGLNRRIHGRSGGFTTCLILRADPNGTLSIANAGHLSPYSNGKEILVEAGLPLGILLNATYEVVTHQLEHGESITLLTDGVIEARNSIGELFGFDRTQAISHQAAPEIAQAARDFGQNDDITVLKLCRV
jgi:hypothetical protein